MLQELIISSPNLQQGSPKHVRLGSFPLNTYTKETLAENQALKI